MLPCLEGLGDKAGPLVFQISPLPEAILGEPATLAQRLNTFFVALPKDIGRHRPIYALDLRNPELVTPRLMKMLGEITDNPDVGFCGTMGVISTLEFLQHFCT